MKSVDFLDLCSFRCEFSLTLHRLAKFCWIALLLLITFSPEVESGNLTGNPTLLEANNGNVRIHTSIIFTCTLQWKPGTSPLLMAMNFMFDEGTVCASYETAGPKLTYPSICNGRSTLTKVSDTVYRLEMTDAALTDQKQFYCKPYETFSSQEESVRVPITVQVPPQEPIITLSNTSTLVANNNTALTLTCVANTGKPRGSLTWYQTMMDAQGQMMPEVKINSETSVPMPQANGTVVVKDTVVITALSEAYNGARYRCAATNPILGPTEEGPSVQANLDVQYAVKSLTIVTNGEQWTGSRVIQTATTISCTAKGNPTPTYSWIQVSGPGTPTATGGTLLASLSDTLGNYSYMCNASNTVAGQPTHQSITINFEIRAPPTTTPIPTTVTPAFASTTTKNSDSGNGNTGATSDQVSSAGIIGGVIGALAALIIIIIIVVCVCRNKKKPGNSQPGKLLKSTAASRQHPPPSHHPNRADEDTEKGGKYKGQGLDNGPVGGGYDVELDDTRPYDYARKQQNGGAIPIDTVDNTPGSRKGFHVPADPSYDPAYM